MHAMSIALPAMTAEVVRMWIADGTAARLTEILRRETAARQALMGELFKGFDMRRHPASFHVLLHLPEPWAAEELALAARERGLIVIAAPSFAVTRGAAPAAIRISLSGAANEESLGLALGDLRSLLNAGPRQRRGII